MNTKDLLNNPYETYTNSLINNKKKSKYLSKTVLFGDPYDRYIKIILEYFPKDSPIFTKYKKILIL
jgi:hypothetical protein